MAMQLKHMVSKLLSDFGKTCDLGRRNLGFGASFPKAYFSLPGQSPGRAIVLPPPSALASVLVSASA